ncbi:MAG: efflux RND transporter periplasmic adaptor subunit [Calditrichaeota bacterium]|nr:efflux RND transporter periplasmic adaptor subunit [Calditrichota bacterium]
MKQIIIFSLLLVLACEDTKQTPEEIKADYIAKNKEFSDKASEAGLDKALITSQINYLQSIQLDTASSTDNSSVAVRVARITIGSIQDEVELAARLEAYQEIEILSSVSGKVSQFKSNGDYVKAGDFIYKADADLFYQKYISAKANLVQAEKSLEKWQNDIKTYEKLLKSNDISRDEYQNYEIQYLRADQSKTAANVLSEEAKLAYENAAYRAPFSGYVGNINLTIGQQISPGQSIGKLADFSKFKVVASLSVDEVQRFKKGDRAEFKAGSINLEGAVESVSPIADNRTGTYLARIAFNNIGNKQMVSGVFGKIKLYGTRYKDKYVLEQADILDQKGQKFIYVVEKGKTRRVDITEELRIGSKSIVSGDFKENDLYVTSGAGRLAANLEVSIIE